MKLYIVINANGSIQACGTTPIGDESIEVDVENAEEILANIEKYKFIDGSFLLKSDEEIEEEQNKPQPPTLEERLLTEIEHLREEKKMADLALLELVELVLGGIEGGE